MPWVVDAVIAVIVGANNYSPLQVSHPFIIESFTIFRYCTSFRISHGSEVPKVLIVSKQPGYLADINQA